MLSSMDTMCLRAPHRAHTPSVVGRCKANIRSNLKKQHANLISEHIINPWTPYATHSTTSRLSVRARASGNNNSNNNNSDNNNSNGQQGSSGTGIPAGLLLFVGSLAYTFTNLREELTDLLYNDDSLADLGFAGFGLGDAAGALLWAVALWYVSPLQLLLVFLGKFDTERPSDWIMNKFGKALQQPVDAIDYVVPLNIKAAAAAICLAGGVAAAGVLGAGLDDPIWSVSSGIGALFAAAIFEVGRPKRMSVAEAQQLESQWQDFATFADARLQRSGRCHESEVFQAFRQRYGRYRSSDVIGDPTLRDMIRNWHPGVERTRTGYLRNISLKSLGPGSDSNNSSRGRARASIEEQQPVGVSAEQSLLDSIAEAAEKDLKV